VLWVHVGDAGVVEVYAKVYFLGDSEGVYGLGRGVSFEKPEFESAFGR
jgi:hypothetical protein